MIIAIDPGPEMHAYVVLDGARLHAHGYSNSLGLRTALSLYAVGGGHDVIFEGVESYGMAVGGETFETVFQTGRLFEYACRHYGDGHVHRLFRKAIKLHLCGSARAKDANIRQALIDRFGGSAAKGTKKAPGPLYGVTSHCWSALAVAVTWQDIARDVMETGAISREEMIDL